ncbi:MAG: hypothetical protein ACRCYA_10230 [Cetobacterium sp.]|uniref:hypothetical protein n=1 Tax=Cetobacterium sp. TaxID=2071632 RepID=UPI003F3F8D54
MKIYYKLKDNQFDGFYHFEDEIIMENYIEIKNEEFNNLILTPGEIVYFPVEKMLKLIEVPENIGLLKPIYDLQNLCFKEGATLEELISFYKNLILSITEKLDLLKISGLEGDNEYLKLSTELEEVKQKYLDTNHELALQLDKNF